ncbi:MAG: type II secretion system protein GspK, partial [Bdellovibrio sp.]
ALTRRDSEKEGGPFKCDKDGGSEDFWGYVQTKGARLEGDPKNIPLTCDNVMNFKIRSTGEFAGATREITAIVMDINQTATKIKSYVDKEKKEAEGAEEKASDQERSGTPGKTSNKKDSLPKGAPRIVYWNER